METALPEPKQKGTREQLVKIPNFPCLYRHEQNQKYYGIKKHKGRIIPKSLDTTDRKIAERELKKWIESLTAPKAVSEVPTLGDLYAQFLELKKGQKDGTKKSYTWMKRTFETGDGGKALWGTHVNEIKASALGTFFAPYQKKFKPNTYNSFTLLVKQLFDVALMDEIIDKNPYDFIPNNRQKVSNKPDEVPTVEQCEIIAASIRSQPFADTRDKSADMCEFLHMAALGEAEAIRLRWRDVDFTRKRLYIQQRVKTGSYFEVPMLPYLFKFMADLHERQGKPRGEQTVFRVKSIKQALYSACKRLKLPAYSPRDLRKARITHLLRQGVPVEIIAGWQGHKDNGVLIRRTYSNVTDDGKRAYEQSIIDKLN